MTRVDPLLPLRDLQQQLFRAITGADGDPAAVTAALRGAVHGAGALEADARLAIYAGMYRARLLEALAEDFPRVRAVLGPRWDEVALAYLQASPSRHPSLRHLGRGLPAFLATQAASAGPPFLADLARLEWVRLEVFDAEDAAVFQSSTLRVLRPDMWATLELSLVPAFRTLESAWPIHAVWKAAGTDDARNAEWSRAPTTVRVWRQDFVVYQASMDAIERRAIDCLRAGPQFAAVCDLLGRDRPPAEAARVAGALLVRWIEDGILVAP